MPVRTLPTALVALTVGGVVLFAAGVIRGFRDGGIEISDGVMIMIAGLVLVSLAMGAMTVYRMWVREFDDLVDSARSSLLKHLAQDKALGEIDRTRAARYGGDHRDTERTRD